MPARTPPPQSSLRDGVFRALADPTRREVVERLGRGAASVSQLAGGFDMALPSFVEHLRVLEASGLVRSQKRGRVRTYELAPGGLRPLEDWLAAQRRLWERRLDQLDEYLLRLQAAEEQRHPEQRQPVPDHAPTVLRPQRLSLASSPSTGEGGGDSEQPQPEQPQPEDQRDPRRGARP